MAQYEPTVRVSILETDISDCKTVFFTGFRFLNKEQALPDVLSIANVSLTVEEKSRTGWITDVFVHPEYRLQQVGTAMMRAVLKYALQYLLEGVSLKVEMKNAEAIGLYRKFGFFASGEDNDEVLLMSVCLKDVQIRV